MYSMYHFYRNLVINKKEFFKTKTLDQFPFDTDLLASKSKGRFPDLSIKLSHNSKNFTGGELIELKDSNSYQIASFNSTIPTGRKQINSIIAGKNSKIRQQMEAAGNNIKSLLERDVFYLVRGKKEKNKIQKIVLIHGSFFETITKQELISQSFLQVLEERLKEKGKNIKPKLKNLLALLFSKQDNFSKIRNIEKASVKLRFRIMTEVKAEGNILDPKKYPAILDNTLNFVLPCHKEDDREEARKKMELVFSKKELKKIKELKVKHHLNGNFVIFQTQL